MNFLLGVLIFPLPYLSQNNEFWLSKYKAKEHLSITQKYGGEDPHGADPHGDDPHDENHDPGLPANQENKKNKAPRDVYGGDIPNGQSPSPP